MSKKEDYEARTEQLVMPILEQNNFTLYDVEYEKEAGTMYLRVYIDKEEGITLDDCELVSRAMNELLDKYDYIDDVYIFEVSSPGLGRQLKKDRHFEGSLGEEVDVKLYKPIDKVKQFTGILSAYDKDTITIELEDGDMVFNRKDIASVRLTIDF